MHADEKKYIQRQIDHARQKIKSTRLERGFSLRHLSALAEVDTDTINDFENGKRSIRLEKLVALCQALEIGVANLWIE